MGAAALSKGGQAGREAEPGPEGPSAGLARVSLAPSGLNRWGESFPRVNPGLRSPGPLGRKTLSWRCPREWLTGTKRLSFTK